MISKLVKRFLITLSIFYFAFQTTKKFAFSNEFGLDDDDFLNSGANDDDSDEEDASDFDDDEDPDKIEVPGTLQSTVT